MPETLTVPEGEWNAVLNATPIMMETSANLQTELVILKMTKAHGCTYNVTARAG